VSDLILLLITEPLFS